MNFIRKILFLGTDSITNPIELEKILLCNKYIIVSALMFFYHAIFHYFLIGYSAAISPFFVFLLLISILFSNLKRNNIAIVLVEIFISIVLFISSSKYGFESGFVLYYIPLILSLSILFDFNKNKFSIIAILYFIISEVTIILSNNNDFFKISNFTDEMRKSVLLIVIIDFVLLLILSIYIIYKKNELLFDYQTTIEEKEKIISLISSKEVISNDNLNKLIILSIKNSPDFYPKFKEFYPLFCEKILKTSPNLTENELVFCAYLKLNFSTKEIAQYTKSSIRSVESKKYRIRKKIGISGEEEISNWLLRL